MEQDPPASEPPRLPCDVFLDAPNEVSEPDFGLFRETLNRHFYPARIEALDRCPPCASHESPPSTSH
jgi:hypothetical protein